MYATVPFAATFWLVEDPPVCVILKHLQGGCIMSDFEAVVAAVEEAQRILGVYDEATSSRNQDDFLAMLQFVLCNPSVALAIRRLKSRARLSLVK